MPVLTVGLDGRFLQDKFHGIGRYLHGLVAALAELEAMRVVLFVDPTVPNLRFPLQDLRLASALEFQECRIPMYSPSELWRWPAMVSRQKIDVFHSPYFWSPLTLSCPLVSTVHDMIFDRYPEFVPGSPLRPIYRVASRLMLRRSAAVVTGSRASADDIVGIGRVPAGRVNVIPYGVEAKFNPRVPGEEVARVRVGYGLPARYVLAVGARRPHKNVRRLVEAFGRVMDDVEQSLVLVGSIDRRIADDAEPALHALRHTGRVLELDHVEEADLPAVYAGADLLVQPSIIEGFGLPVLEAMACGCPVAAARAPGVSEVAADATEMFDPLVTEQIADAILRVLGSAQRGRQLAQLGLARAASFTWPNAARMTLELYQRVVGSG